jgi:putative toxin-antitoxin system antitoxin component (TIGR02293 family)
MPHAGTDVVRSRRTRMAPRRRPVLGIAPGDAVAMVRLVRAGLPFRALARLQAATELPWAEIARLVAIPLRTLARRQKQGTLQPDESDRVLRTAMIFERAVELFAGDAVAARRWLRTGQPALGGETPLDFATTEIGAREVERLMGRLEHGVFT